MQFSEWENRLAMFTDQQITEIVPKENKQEDWIKISWKET